MNRKLPPLLRRVVLGGAFLAASLVVLLPESPPVSAAESTQRLILAQNDAKAAAEVAKQGAEDARRAAREATEAAKDAARESANAARDAAREARRKGDIDINVGVDDDEDKPGHRKGINIGIGGVDRQYDSIDQFLDRDPALASMVLGIVFIVFLTPILMIALIIWYKMRKNRMQNETMLKLAEKGLVPPGEAMQAIGTGRVGAVLSAAASTAPLAEQARALRTQAAWSDLRKGVIMGTVGLALTLYSIFDDRSPSWIGLVLLFVGIGYVVLWYFEDRQAAAVLPMRAANPAPPPGPGDTSN